MIRRQEYGSEVSSIIKSGNVKKNSKVNKLCPIYVDGVLRVGGRLHEADLSVEAKRPVILPKDHNVTRMIIRK